MGWETMNVSFLVGMIHNISMNYSSEKTISLLYHYGYKTQCKSSKAFSTPQTKLIVFQIEWNCLLKLSWFKDELYSNSLSSEIAIYYHFFLELYYSLALFYIKRKPDSSFKLLIIGPVLLVVTLVIILHNSRCFYSNVKERHLTVGIWLSM